MYYNFSHICTYTTIFLTFYGFCVHMTQFVTYTSPIKTAFWNEITYKSVIKTLHYFFTMVLTVILRISMHMPLFEFHKLRRGGGSRQKSGALCTRPPFCSSPGTMNIICINFTSYLRDLLTFLYDLHEFHRFPSPEISSRCEAFHFL